MQTFLDPSKTPWNAVKEQHEKMDVIDPVMTGCHLVKGQLLTGRWEAAKREIPVKFFFFPRWGVGCVGGTHVMSTVTFS